MKCLLVTLAVAVAYCCFGAVPAFAEWTDWYGDGVGEVTAAQQWVVTPSHQVFQDNQVFGAAGAPVCEALTFATGKEETVQYSCGYGEIYKWNGNCYSQLWAWGKNNYKAGGPLMRVYGDAKVC